MKLLWCLALIIAVGLHVSHAATDPDVNRNAYEMITARGFPVESHQVTTQDGYILTIFRLPQSSPAPVVLISPGFTCSCVQLLLQTGDTTLPFQLWEQGFEVWLGNFRGTTYGVQHVSLTPSDADFWKYSIDELAKYDLQDTISYVLKTSGQSKITTLIGHSEGGTVGLAGLSTYPGVYNNVKSFIGLGQAVYMANTQSAMVHALETMTPILKTLGFHKFQASTTAFKDIVPGFCTLFPSLCQSVICWVAGCESADSLESDRIPVLLNHYPDNSSVQDMDHWIVSTSL
jgi:lysosomal acid lipase/cholesteryl ester hydrolase